MHPSLDGGALLFYAYLFIMFVLFLFSTHNFVMIYYFLKHRHRPPQKSDGLLSRPRETWPTVTVQLPIFNESNVAGRLIDATCAFDWPKDRLEIQVLDDSTDDTLGLTRIKAEEYRRKGYNIAVLNRIDRTGYKAGALREGLEKATGEFIAIFDADFIPEPDFLIKTIPYFASDKIGMVQTRWSHLNEDYSILTESQAIGLNGHFVIQQLARNRAGLFINFNGTGGVWRQSCIHDAGNWHDDTLTEDLDLSYRAQLKGWKFVFLNDVVSPGELPLEINALKSQQFRWTKGSVETAKKLIPKILRSELSPWVKLQSVFHLTANFSWIFVVIACLLNSSVLFLENEGGRFNVILDVMTFFVVTMIGLFVFYFYSEKTITPHWKKRMLLSPIFMMGSLGLSLTNAKAVIEGFFNVKSAFIRTPKWGFLHRNRPSPYKVKIDKLVMLEIAMICYMLWASAVGIQNFVADKSNFIGMIFFNFWIMTGFMMVTFLTLKNVYQNRGYLFII